MANVIEIFCATYSYVCPSDNIRLLPTIPPPMTMVRQAVP